ncbi:MAG: deoxyhypusine synthase family protein [Patescibacteria group bacterium]|nr:deoxyhypusine synthase family protein [Patescibacteria group bacterium]
MTEDIRKNMVALQPMDIAKLGTVGEIVNAMKYCAFGARMLGEVADTICQWCASDNKPVLVYDGLSVRMIKMLANLVERGWCKEITTPDRYANQRRGRLSETRLVVIGGFSERQADELYKCDEAIFINQYDLAPLGTIREGFYPNVVFSDHSYIMPIISAVLEERLGGQPQTMKEFWKRHLDKADGALAKEVRQAGPVLKTMIEDPTCQVALTISGAMTVGKMGLLVCEMIDRGWVQLVTTTGALMAHGLVEGIGLKHYKYDPDFNDEELAEQKLNRVTDTLEPEENLDQVADVIGAVLAQFNNGSCITSPSILNRMIGEHLARYHPNARGILKSAFEKNVPVLVPALCDSELGNDIFVHNMRRTQQEGRQNIIVDMEIDTMKLVEFLTNEKFDRHGIFTIGGGVPRNYTQNGEPLIEIANDRLPGLNWRQKPFSYGCRICPDKPHPGHLSGCTYKEGVSWRKMDEHGLFAEVHADATLVWPFLVRYCIDHGL